MKKIDIHAHVTNRRVEDCSEPDASLGHLVELMDKNEIEKTVVLASYFPFKGTGVSNFRLYDWISKSGYHDRFLMFGSLDFENYYFQGMSEIEELAERKVISGLKVYSGYQDIDLKSENFDNFLQMAEKYSLAVMFHTGYSYTTKRRYGVESLYDMVNSKNLVPLVEKYPNVNFIASHMSKPFFDDNVDAVMQHKNLYTDVSGLIDSKYDADDMDNVKEEVELFVKLAGPYKLLFGTDFPVQSHSDSIGFVEHAMKGYSDSFKELVYYKNAMEVLGIS